MGGADATLSKARAAFELGDYRWVAEVVNHVVFADPDNQAARELQAGALEQLGYQAESGPWRNFYLTAAQELRHGVQPLPTPSTASPDSVRAMSTALFLDYLAVRLNGSKAGDRPITLGLALSDVGESWTLIVRNGALSHRVGIDPDADATLTIDRSDLDEVILGTAPIADQIADGRAKLKGDDQALRDFIGLLDDFEFWFNIATP
jgi:alkyl sulfatase BDS1-like metallo-beta-lactamase superfamily hydrolase